MSTTKRSIGGARRERGAVAVVVAVSIVTLVLMIGLVLDLAHIFIVKNELQNAADACALSGARELGDTSTGLLERATGAAVTAGTRNRVDLQRDAVAIDGLQEVLFSDTFEGPYAHAVDNGTRYVRCSPHETNLKSVVSWFMQVAGIRDTKLSAEAIAKYDLGEGMCAIPIAMCSLSGVAEDLVQGTWYSGLLGAGNATTGMYDWVSFPGMTGGNDISNMLAGEGMCVTPRPTKVDGKGGGTGGASQAWNTRFGLYGGSYKVDDIADHPPDWTGYTYYASTTWPKPAPQNAYPDFLLKREQFAPYVAGSVPGNLPGGAAPISTDLHKTFGKSRRMAMVPIIRCQDWESWPANKKGLPVIKWACALMISPISGPDAVHLEFRGLEGTPNCEAAATEGNNPKLVK